MATSLTTAAAAARYRALFEAAADPILVADADGQYVDANRAALTLLGYTLEELLLLHVGDVSVRSPEDLGAEYARLQRDHGWQGESMFRRTDGSIFPVEIRASQADLPEGTLYFAAFRDLTERVRAEEQLRESEARLRALLDQLPVGVGLTDAEGRWVLTNDPMTRFVGEVTASRDPRRMARWQVWDAHGRALDPIEWPAARAFRGETVAGVDALFTPEQGAAQWRRLSAAPFHGADGELLGVIAVNQDIDAYKQAGEQLRASEARLSALLEQLPVAVGLTDVDGRWTLSNALMGRFVHHAIPSRDPSQIARWRSWDADGRLIEPSQWPGARALSGEYVPGMDFLFTAEIGEELWTRVSAAPFRDTVGEVVGAICVIEDIDDRKRAVTALRESEARYRSLVHATAHAVFRMSADGERLLEVLGGPNSPLELAQEATDAWLTSYVHPEDQAATLAAWRQAVATQSVYDHVQRVRATDGSYRWVRSRTVPVVDEHGEVQEWIGTSTDITERIQAEAINARLASIIASSRDAILSETLDGIILDWNPGAEALYGYAAEEAVGRHVGFLIPPERAHEPTEVLPRLGRGELVAPLETVRLRKDGSRVEVEVRLSPLHDAQGRVIGISAIARDITARKRLEQLRQDVLAIASHDLRTPLAVISMRAQLLQTHAAYDEAGVGVIREQTRLMARLVDDLGDAVRLETGQVELRPEELDLRIVADEAVDRVQTQTGHQHIRVETPETPVLGTWDRTRLEEVLDNLLGNAVKYSPAGGEIVVRVALTDGEAQLSVADQGLGIPAETLPRLFERFHRGAGTGTPGLGLGLYIARMLVEAHGGRIGVESAPGQGSTFTAYLPLVLAA